MKAVWINLGRLLYALPIASVAMVLLITAGWQEAGKIVYAPDRSYYLRLPADWESKTVKDGLARAQLALFFEAPGKAKLEIRKFPAHKILTAQAMAERDEAQDVRFKAWL